jgi:hypothetical protein
MVAALLVSAGGAADAGPARPDGTGSAAGAAGSAAPVAPEVPSVRADFDNDGFEDLAVSAAFEAVGTAQQAGAVHVLFGAGTGLTGAGSQLYTQGSPGIGSDPETDDSFGWALASGDYDDDGFTDLAIGVAGESVGAAGGAGAVQVLYGSTTGLTAAGSQTLTQDTAGVGDQVETGDQFGGAVATGDYDGDGVDDLAIGAEFDSVSGAPRAGVAHVLYGTAGSGLSGAGSTTVSQSGPNVPSDPENGDEFGFALTAGDFDNDGRDDLAVASPSESVGSVAEAGSVTTFRGTPSGITTAGARVFTQDTPGVPGTAEVDDNLGTALAAADFDDDGRDDLAVGASNEAVGAIAGAGAVTVFKGSTAGLTGTGGQQFTQDSGNIPGSPERLDTFGAALAAADFDGDGRDDLGVGVVAEGVGSASMAGAVNVVYGTPGGLSAARAQQFVQGSGGVATTAAALDNFGFSLASADFTGDGRDDLVVGAIGENVSGANDAGMIHLLRSTPGGLTGNNSQTISQATAGVGDDPESQDLFGFAVSALRSPG